MRAFFSFLFPKKSNPTSHVFFLLSFLYILSFIILGIIAGTCPDKKVWFWCNAMMVSGAVSVCGFLIGFLFGIPRSVRYGYNKKSDAASIRDDETYFADNTNLEEISDWITKIIIGITLTQYQYILLQLRLTADEIAKSFPQSAIPNGMFVFSYCLLLLNFGLGFFGAYYWARTRFGSILARNRRDLLEIMQVANRNLSNVAQATTIAAARGFEAMTLSIENLKTKVAGLLKRHHIVTKDDSQKNRWIDIPASENRVLRANVTASIIPKLFDVIIEVASASKEFPLEKTVVVLLDETFPEDVIYLNPENNVAKVTVLAYEAFTVAALCDDAETKLELDLQQVKGFPSGFYYS